MNCLVISCNTIALRLPNQFRLPPLLLEQDKILYLVVIVSTRSYTSILKLFCLGFRPVFLSKTQLGTYQELCQLLLVHKPRDILFFLGPQTPRITEHLLLIPSYFIIYYGGDQLLSPHNFASVLFWKHLKTITVRCPDQIYPIQTSVSLFDHIKHDYC